MSVIQEMLPVQPPVTPHIDMQPETPLPASSTNDDPMMVLSRTRNTVDPYRAGYTSDHSTASAVATHTNFSVTGGVEHVHW